MHLAPLLAIQLLLAPISASSEAEASSEAHAAVVELLLEQREAGHGVDPSVVERLRSTIASDPAPAIQILFDGVIEVPPKPDAADAPELQVLNRYQRRATLLSLDAAPNRTIAPLLPSGPALRAASEEIVATTLEVLGATQRGRDAAAVLEAARLPRDEDGRRPDLPYERREALRDALALLIEREQADAVEALTRQLNGEAPGETLAVVQAVGDAGNPHGLVLLLEALQAKVAPVDSLASQVARLGATLSPRLNNAVAEQLVEALDTTSPNTRKQIARALGALESRIGVERLVALLEDEDTGVREMAHRALQSCARSSLPNSAKLWNGLFDRELILEGRAEEFARDLGRSSAGSVAQNARLLAGASIARHTVAAELGRLVVSDRELIRDTAASLLENLASIEGLEPHVRFGIIAFATKTKRWKKTLVPANVINKESALDFVKPEGKTQRSVG
ncbi:MAG: HEAT repeat domain-containing protein, partial [Planctomycetota bacterium]